MPLVHFDRQVVLDFLGITIQEAEDALKSINHKDPIDVTDEFSGDDVKAIAMTYAHRRYPTSADKDKVSFGSQVSYCVCGMYTGVAHYYKEQKAERVFEELKKAFGVDPGDEGPEIKGEITPAEFTVAGILVLEGMILPPDPEATVNKGVELLSEHADRFERSHLEAIQKVLSGLSQTRLL